MSEWWLLDGEGKSEWCGWDELVVWLVGVVVMVSIGWLLW